MRRKHTNIHHRLAQSQGGTDTFPSYGKYGNVIRVNIDDHIAYHRLFGNKTVDQVAEIISRWVDPRFQVIAVMRGSHKARLMYVAEPIDPNKLEGFINETAYMRVHSFCGCTSCAVNMEEDDGTQDTLAWGVYPEDVTITTMTYEEWLALKNATDLGYEI
jgi:hypothetical protein